jgi:uncharacterized protein YecE (DUF72 family)
MQRHSDELMATIRIGLSGWRYPPWRGVFYPRGLAQSRELEFASRAFPTIEINGSFYSLQRPSSYAAWYQATPPGFVFSIKGGRYITHMLRLVNAEGALANFFASGIFNLKEKIGPFLWQFPPQFRYREDVFENFFKQLPHDLESAAVLAKRRQAHMAGRSRLAIDSNHRLRHAVEIRHQSFVDERFIAQLRRHRIALVVADTAGKWPLLEDVTADFVYIRLHGDEELYVSGYTAPALDRWANRISLWSAGSQPPDANLAASPEGIKSRPRDVYCYFDNDVKVRAPVDAHNLMRRLGLANAEEGESDEDRSLEVEPDVAAFTSAELATRWKFGKTRKTFKSRARSKAEGG